MKIVVCVKSVPDSETKPKPADAGFALANADTKYIVNPYDEFALELALQVKEKNDGSTVHVVSLCPADRDPTAEIRKGALAIGCDDATILKDASGSRDTFGEAKVLADHIKGVGDVDLVLFGKLWIDDDTHAVGQMVATLLDLPCATAIESFEMDGTTATVSRGIEGGSEVIKLALPAVLTTDKGLNQPRYANLKGIMAAKKKPVNTADAAEVAATVTTNKLETPPARPDGKIVGDGADAVPELVKLLRDEAKVL